MARQIDENTYGLMVRIPLEDAAKLFTLKERRKVSMSRCAAAVINRAVARVKPSPSALKWARDRLLKNQEIRQRADEDTRSGRFRKPD